MDEKQHSFIYRVITNGILAFVLGSVFSLIQMFPDSWINPIAKVIIVLIFVLITVIITVGKEFYNDFIHNIKIKTEIDYLNDILTQFVHTHYQNLMFKLKEGGDVEISTCIEIENKTQKVLTGFPIPMFYDIYDIQKEVEYLPVIKSIEIGCDVIQQISNPKKYLEIEGILRKKDGTYEGLTWTIVPLKLEPAHKIRVKMVYEQKHIFKKMEVMERAYSYITTPTDRMKIIIEPPLGKKIAPITIKGKSIKIVYKILDLEDLSEEERVEFPTFYDKVEWIVSKPKIGNLYMLLFKVE